MRVFIVICLVIFSFETGVAQKNEKPAYPSLLWEITGNGLNKPSYLFGTMHVSNKLVFHLSDSFYHAIAACSTVSLELDPKQWQPEMFRVLQSQLAMSAYARFSNDYLRESSFKLSNDYEDNIKRALSEEPYVINGLLYRTAAGQSDFQENTYLDLYVYQTARKLGKKATGVENYLVSEKIQLEAQEDMMKDRRNNNRINIGQENPYEIQRKIQEAYRRGDLSQLDSLSKLSGNSEAYNEKFLYGRNQVQADAIDSIIHRESLFVAVGAAHLPGNRGVIEMLRKKGYTLRPVNMNGPDATERDKVDKIRIPVSFQPFTSGDGFIRMQVPGNFFRRYEDPSNESWQYADMENGTYYTLSRISLHQGDPREVEKNAARKTDSLLYEYVPGKILLKKNITVNGYNGFDITNKTRRGDIQRYNIFFTPQEILVFKIGGVDEYVNGPEADQFFQSIQLKERTKVQWLSFSPAAGGFSVNMPQMPSVNAGKTGDQLDNIQWETSDADNGDSYMIWRKDLHNYSFLEEDTLDLSLIEESLKSSEIIDKQQSRKFGKQNGLVSLDMLFSLKEGGVLKARAVINGPNYYLLTARSKDSKNSFSKFFNSFQLTEHHYPAAETHTDKALGFTVQTPVKPAVDEDLRDFLNKRQYNAFDILYNDRYQPRGMSRYAFFKSDSTGEAILVSSMAFPKYYYQKDTTAFWETELGLKRQRDDLVIDRLTYFNGPDSSLRCSYSLLDTNTNRRIKVLAIQRDNMLYKISALINKTGTESSFIKDFYGSFQPLADQRKAGIFEVKSAQLLADLSSKDSVVEKIAKEAMASVSWSGADFNALKNAFENVNPSAKDYLLAKSRFIQAIGTIKDTVNEEQRVKWLTNIYKIYVDTTTYQTAALRALASAKTKRSYDALKEILVQSPAILDNTVDYLLLFRTLGDSLSLAGGLYPSLLELVSLDDYKPHVINLLIKLVDSGYIKKDVYAQQFNKFFFDAQIQFRKLQNLTERETIRRSQADGERDEFVFRNQPLNSPASDVLNGYLGLLLPFYDNNTQVTHFFEKILQGSDIQAKMTAATLLARTNRSVNDSVWESIAANDQYRAALFEGLDKIKKPELFPAKYKTQEAMVKSLMMGSYSRNFIKPAEVLIAGSKMVQVKNTKGYVYFFKYKLQKQGDWLIGLCGLQPEMTTAVNTDKTLFSMNNKKLQNDTSEEEQFDKLAKQTILAKRKSAAVFFNQQNFGSGGLFF